MTDQGKSLKKSLEDAANRVQKWPDWKKALESATTESQYSRVPNPSERELKTDDSTHEDGKQ